MPFDRVQRVIYRNNPLIQVECQLRFPRILTINEKLPADFQDRIRKSYPIYNVAIEHQQQFIVEPGRDLSTKVIQNERMNCYSFQSDDRNWQISLACTYISLTTSQYTRWEDFRSHLQAPLQALCDIYGPAFYDRIGLRYINAFCRSSLNFDINTSWTDLITPFALGFLSNSQIAVDVKGYSATSDVDLGNDAVARIVTSTGFVGNAVFQQNPELSFIVDSDLFYNSRKPLSELDSSLDYLNEYAGRIIRSIISEKLHQQMEPQEV